jgi:hypothetical protein
VFKTTGNSGINEICQDFGGHEFQVRNSGIFPDLRLSDLKITDIMI